MGTREGSGSRGALVTLVLVALALRLAVVWAVGSQRLVEDEIAYQQSLDAARLLVRWPPGGLECRPPGYPLFLHALGMLGRSRMGLFTCQAVLSALTLVPLFVLGRRWVGERAALAAAAILAVYPAHIAYAALLMSETLYLFVLVLALALLLRPAASRAQTVVAAVVFGVAVLVRGVLLPFVPVLLLWVIAGRWWPRVERPVRAGLVLLGVVGAFAPWTVRNAVVYHEFLPVDCQGMYNLWQGNNVAGGWNVGIARLYYEHSDSPAAREAYAREQVLAHVRADPARWAVAKTVRMVPALFGAQDDELARYLEMGRFGRLPPWLAAATRGWLVAAYLAVAAAGLAGLVLAAADPRKTLVVCLGAFVVVAHVAAFALSRHRLPLVPFFALFAGVLLVRPAGVWQPSRGRVAGAVAAVAILLAIALAPAAQRGPRGRNFGNVTSGPTSSNTTSTGMPISSWSGRQPTTFETSRAPSSSSTTTTAYGTSPAKPG